jgi:hypothetical protein
MPQIPHIEEPKLHISGGAGVGKPFQRRFLDVLAGTEFA